MRHSKADQAPGKRRRHLPGPFRFLTRILSAALILAMTLVLLPHVTRLVGQLWPDPARTTRVSEILRHELNQSARLETLTVDDQGVLTATVQAALIGEVQRVTIDYDYHASVGMDLEKAQISAEGGHITLTLPPLELLSDSLTPTHVDRQDFWYPLTEKRRNQLLTEEREKRAAAALADAQTGQIIQETIDHLQHLVQSWIGMDTWLMTIQIEMSPDEKETENNASAS